MIASPYKRLPGMGRQIASYSRLYLAEDHLLHVASSPFSERYKRFYFRDIQALILIRTETWIWILGAWLMAALLGVVIAVAANEAIVSTVFGCVAGLFLTIGIIHVVAGPTCRCYVRTAVQMERLPSLSRLRRAQTILARITPSITQAQGTWPAPQVTSAEAEYARAVIEPAETAKVVENPVQEPPPEQPPVS